MAQPRIKRRLSALRELFDRYVGHGTPIGGETDYECPFCEKRHADHIGTLHVNFEKGAAICHSCHMASRNLVNVLRDVTGLQPRLWRNFQSEVRVFSESRKEFRRAVKETLWPRFPKAKIVGLPIDFERLTLPPSDIASRVFYRYLQSRSVSDEEMDDLGIGYCLRGKYSGHVVFPFWQNGMPVYFSTRAVLAGPPKTLNPKADRRFYLFNFDRAIATGRVVLVEGCFDAVAVGRSGCAVLGKTVHEAQIEMLGRHNVREIVVMFDADARDETMEAAETLFHALRMPIGYVRLKWGDPSDRRNDLPRLLEKPKKLTLGRILTERLFNKTEKQEDNRTLRPSQDLLELTKQKLRSPQPKEKTEKSSN